MSLLVSRISRLRCHQITTVTTIVALSNKDGIVGTRRNADTLSRPRIIGALSGNDVVSASNAISTTLLVEGVGIGKDGFSKGRTAHLHLVFGGDDFTA